MLRAWHARAHLEIREACERDTGGLGGGRQRGDGEGDVHGVTDVVVLVLKNERVDRDEKIKQ